MRIAKALTFSTFVAIGAGASSGCNPGDFNSVLDKAPVMAFGTSSSGTGPLFVLPLPPPADPGTKVAARMLVSRQDSTYLAVANYDKDGKVSLHEPSSAEYDALGASKVNSMVLQADGTILLGTPDYLGGSIPPGRVNTLTLTTQADGSVGFGIQNGIQGGGAATRLGISVAAGNLTGQVGGDHSVVLGDGTVQVLANPIASTDAKCQQYVSLGSLSDVYAFRPVVVVDLLGSDGAAEIVISGPPIVAGQPNTTLPGIVAFLTYAEGASTLGCPKTLTSTSPNFGTSLAAGDFDGDGHQDLAVGTPPDKVYVYFGPLDSATVPDVTITSTTATKFGQRLAAYAPPGQLAAQLLVADPLASVGQREKVGKVMIFNISRSLPAISTTDAVATLFDSNQDSDQPVFGGASLGGLEFDTSICSPGAANALVPWVSINTDILTFFAYPANPVSPADPRCFGK